MGATPPKAVTNHFPQVGGNRTTESSEVVFNHIQGDEGVESPPPNDSLQASLSPPLGGRLPFFQKRLANKQMFRQCVKHYHQCLHSSIHLKNLGDEGVETPPPNDSLKASLNPPVGGCLRSFRRDWQQTKVHPTC